MYNKVILLGRICSDLELKTTPSGVPVLSFPVACDRRYQEQGKDRKSDFFNCIAWRNEAEFISKYWTKGRAILLEGELQNRKYTDKNGVERQVTEVIVDRACFTGDKAQGGGRPPLPDEPPPVPAKSGTAQRSEPAGEPKQYTAEDFAKAPGDDDDYPF